MSTIIEFDDTDLQALGRNGYMRCEALDITPIKGGEQVVLTPVNSRRVLGRRHIEIQTSKIPGLIDVLSQIHSRGFVEQSRLARKRAGVT